MKPLGKPSLTNRDIKELVTGHRDGTSRTTGQKTTIAAWKRSFKRKARQQDKKMIKEDG